jgi:hypothetical protein
MLTVSGLTPPSANFFVDGLMPIEPEQYIYSEFKGQSYPPRFGERV